MSISMYPHLQYTSVNTMQTTQYHLIPQLTPKDECVDQFLTIGKTRRLGNSSDDTEPQPLPDTDRSRVVSEDQVEDGVFVSLPNVDQYLQVEIQIQAWVNTYQLRSKLQVSLAHLLSNALPPRGCGSQEPRIANMRATACDHHQHEAQVHNPLTHAVHRRRLTYQDNSA